MSSPIVIAHRTSPAYAPENSLEGIRVSFDQGADGVEVDLRTSLDLGLYLMHDNSMYRTTGWPLPIELTPSSIVRKQKLRPFATPTDQAGGTPPTMQQAKSVSEASAQLRLEGLQPHTETVPTLHDAIQATPDGKLLAVDVKTPWSIFGLVGAIRGQRMEARTLVWCSSALVVRYAVRRLPGVEVAYYKDFEDGPNNIEFVGKAARIGAHAVSLHWLGVTKDVVAAAHSLGLKVYSWHKEYPVTADKLDSGLDGLITDYPARIRAEMMALRQS